MTVVLLLNSLYALGDDCQKLTGAWQGSLIDTQGLFSQKKHPVTLHIQFHEGKFYGEARIRYQNLKHIVNQYFIGQCNQGKLSNVYLNQPRQCGHFGPEGVIKENKLTLYLPYENAMTGTNFKITARPTMSFVQIPIKKIKVPNPLLSCH